MDEDRTVSTARAAAIGVAITSAALKLRRARDANTGVTLTANEVAALADAIATIARGS